VVGLGFYIGFIFGRLRERVSWHNGLREHGHKLPGDH
jgi:hypothetical protein